MSAERTRKTTKYFVRVLGWGLLQGFSLFKSYRIGLIQEFLVESF